MKTHALSFHIALLFVVQTALAQIWTYQTTLPTFNYGYCGGLAVSADGSRPVATVYYPVDPFDYNGQESPVCLSTNSGGAWTQNFSLYPYYWWGLISSSADGTKLAAVSIDGSVSFSTNSGLSWTHSFNEPQATWYSIATSSDGNTLALVGDNAPIYISTNSGITWASSQPDVSANLWHSVAVAHNGKKIFAANFYPGSIYFTTNYGVSWSSCGVSNQWWSLASSSDGEKLIAGAVGSPILLSTNSGMTWSAATTPNTYWLSVASSADGERLAAITDGGQIYTSADSGATWITNNVPNTNWSTIVSSADGNRLYAVTVGGQIYTSFSTPTPKLKIFGSTSNLTISWTTPSTHFVLEQSATLGSPSWLVVSNFPTLNYTNLENQITLSAPTASVFYRLVTP